MTKARCSYIQVEYACLQQDILVAESRREETWPPVVFVHHSSTAQDAYMYGSNLGHWPLLLWSEDPFRSKTNHISECCSLNNGLAQREDMFIGIILPLCYLGYKLDVCDGD